MVRGALLGVACCTPEIELLEEVLEVEANGFRVCVRLLGPSAEGVGVATPVGLCTGVTEMGVEPISIVFGDEREERGVNIVGGMSEIVRLDDARGSAPGPKERVHANVGGTFKQVYKFLCTPICHPIATP